MAGTPAAAELSDEVIVERVRAGETALYEVVMRRYNARLYRVARGILGSDAEAEDVMQEAYVRAFVHLDQFAGRARFSTWLTKIAVHEALLRARRRARLEEPGDRLRTTDPDTEAQAANEELRRALEAAVDSLPQTYRSVFVLREMEEMSTADVASCLGITSEAVKIRLHRARAQLRKRLHEKTPPRAAYAFHLSRCDRVVAAVFARIGRK
jgi:RNA polymerase sigma-70 factor (ECF subfamily)